MIGLSRTFPIWSLLLLIPANAFAGTVDPNYFPLGVFDAASMENGTDKFEASINDLQAHGLDSIMMVLAKASGISPLLDVSDRKGFNVVVNPDVDLNNSWWPASVPATFAGAMAAAT